MFAQAFLQQQADRSLGPEEALLAAELARRGVPVTLFPAKAMARRRLPLSRQSFVAGDADAVRGALRQLGAAPPAPNDYPPSLRGFLHRQVWTSTLGAVERAVIEGGGPTLFAKPAVQQKAFTGRVFASVDDFRQIGVVSRRQPVWCAEVVDWRSEFRLYVVGGAVVGAGHYAGEADLAPDPATVAAALAAFTASGEAPAAYALDFGVLGPGGATALVEFNDGYALGAYPGVSAAAYADLLLARWQELILTGEGDPP